MAGPYYLPQTILTCKDNAAAMDNLFSMYYVFNKILFDYLKAYYQLSSDPNMVQALMLLTSDILSYQYTGINIKILDKPLSRKFLDKDMGPIYCEPEQTLAYMIQDDDTKLHRNEEDYQWLHRDFLTFNTVATYWQSMELTGFMLSFLAITFSIHLCLCHRRIIYIALSVLEGIPQVYKTGTAAQLHTTP